MQVGKCKKNRGQNNCVIFTREEKQAHNFGDNKSRNVLSLPIYFIRKRTKSPELLQFISKGMHINNSGLPVKSYNVLCAFVLNLVQVSILAIYFVMTIKPLLTMVVFIDREPTVEKESF